MTHMPDWEGGGDGPRRRGRGAAADGASVDPSGILLFAASKDDDKEAILLFVDFAQQWYQYDRFDCLAAFAPHIERIMKLVSSENLDIAVGALRTLAFVSASHTLHRELIECGGINKSIAVLRNSYVQAVLVEAALVVLNQICDEDDTDFAEKHRWITETFSDDERIKPIFRCAFEDETAISLLSNAFALLGRLVVRRREIQLVCALSGCIERAYRLSATHQTAVVRNNCKIFLREMGMALYPFTTFDEMTTLVVRVMQMSSRDMTYIIWKMCNEGEERRRMATDAEQLLPRIVDLDSDRDYQDCVTRHKDLFKLQDLLYAVDAPVSADDGDCTPPAPVRRHSSYGYAAEFEATKKSAAAEPGSGGPGFSPVPMPLVDVTRHADYELKSEFDFEDDVSRPDFFFIPSGGLIRDISESDKSSTVPSSHSKPTYVYPRNPPVKKPHVDEGSDLDLDHLDFDLPLPLSQAYDVKMDSAPAPIRLRERRSMDDRQSERRREASPGKPHSMRHSTELKVKSPFEDILYLSKSSSGLVGTRKHKIPGPDSLRTSASAMAPKMDRRDDDRLSVTCTPPMGRGVSEPSGDPPIDLRVMSPFRIRAGVGRERERRSHPDAYRRISDPLLSPSHEAYLVEEPSGIHVAILQSNPLVTKDSGALQLGKEEKRLKNVFEKTGKQINFFVSVLTHAALMHAFHNDAQVIQVSGHGNKDKDVVAFENHLGELCETSSQKVRDAMGMGKLSTKVVFVSMCYSSNIARCFVEVGVPHVIAVRADVGIRDDYAIEFAAKFYETLLKENTVIEAFNAAKALLSLTEADCCCKSHDGHAVDCRCAHCGRFLCCLVCHAPGASKCPNLREEAESKCCKPDFPHFQHEKFLLMPDCGCGEDHGDDCMHHRKVFERFRPVPILALDGIHEKDSAISPPSDLMASASTASAASHSTTSHCEPLREGVLTDMSPKVKTNIRQEERRLCIVGRQTIVQRLVNLIHPEQPAVMCFFLLYGLQGVGTTTVAKTVARFFVRPWHKNPFPGGVWYVDMKSWDPVPSMPLFSYIATAMHIQVTKGYFETSDCRVTRKYDARIQELLHDAQLARVPQLIHYRNRSDMTVRFLIVSKKVLKATVKDIVGDAIWKEVMAISPLMFPLEVYQSRDGAVNVQTVTYSPAPQDEVIGQICHECGGNSLFIFDQFHGHFEQEDLHRFLEGFNKFSDSLPSARFVVVFNQKHNDILVKLAPEHRLQFRPIHLAPIQPMEAHCLLKLQSRDLVQAYDFAEFDEENRPRSEDELVTYTLFKLMARSPALIYMCAELLTSSLLPLYVPMFCADDPERGKALVEPLKEELLRNGIDYSQAQKSLDSFVAALSSLKAPVASMASAD